MATYAAHDLLKFQSNKTINPATNRKIKFGSKIYKNLERQLATLERLLHRVIWVQQRYRYLRYRSLQSHFHLPFSANETTRDPISLELLHALPKSCVCGICIDGTPCFYHIKSIHQLVHNNITICPLTRKPIPTNILDNMACVARAYARLVPFHDPADDSIGALAKDIFHEFTLESIYLDHTAFLKLNIPKLKTLHYEWKEMFDKNTTADQKQRILGNDTVFPPVVVRTTEQYQRYLIAQLTCLVRPKDASLKTLMTYIMLGGLTLVCPQYSHYRQYCFDF